MKDLLLRLLPNRTRVQQEDIGFLGVVCSLHTMAFLKQVAHARGVVLIHLTAMCLDEDFG